MARQICDNQDNDCDQKIDEEVTRPCGPQMMGVCKPGTEKCASGGEHSMIRELAEFEAEHGLSLREDLVATLGGDFAFAFDGPWLPTPSWKLVLEVNDAGRLQSTLATLVEEWNRDAATAEGEPRPTLSLSQEAIDGQVVYDLRSSNGNDLAHFLFVDGYVVRRTLEGSARRGGRAARRRRHPRRLIELPRSSAA